MKFLIDQDVYAATARFLVDLGHDVITAAQLGLSQATDRQLITTAKEQGRIFVTRDRDFGELVFVGENRTGVIYLRILPATLKVVHQELELAIRVYSNEQLLCASLVIEPGRHRFRKLP